MQGYPSRDVPLILRGEGGANRSRVALLSDQGNTVEEPRLD
jgi:hypothetical protein